MKPSYSWEWKPQHSLGPIQFGSKPIEVRKALGEPAYSGEHDVSRRKAFVQAHSPFAFEDYFPIPAPGKKSKPWSESGPRSGVVVYYSAKDERVCLIALEHSGVAVHFDGIDFSQSTIGELAKILREKDDEAGLFYQLALCSRRLGLAVALPEMYDGQNIFDIEDQPTVLSFPNPEVFQGRFGAYQTFAEVLRSEGTLPAGLSEENQTKISGPAYLAKTHEIWLPLVKSGTADAGSISKFGGKSADFPKCGDCGAVMPLFLQLFSDDTPLLRNRFSKQLWQLFYCTSCENPSPGEDDNGNFRIRISPAKAKQDTLTSETKTLPFAQIVEWRGAKELNPDVEASEIFPIRVDKIGGTPAWIQEDETPCCKHCRSADKMEFFLQLNSNQNIPFSWGDGGSAYIFYCMVHPEAFSLVWQTH